MTYIDALAAISGALVLFFFGVAVFALLVMAISSGLAKVSGYSRRKRRAAV